MSIVVGSGAFQYRLVEDWAKLPAGWALPDVAAVAVDAHDNVFVFNRGAHPMMVFDREGNLLRTWGEDIFQHAHGLHVGPDGALYCTDDGDHTVRKCSPDGKVLLEIGIPGEPTPYMSGLPFHRCTHTALSPEGEIYVADGYGNARVHKYSPDGKLMMSWGEPGVDPGQFNIVHNICCDAEGWVYVADRENHRVQVFDPAGKYEAEWHRLHRPCGLYMDNPHSPLFYVGEIGPALAINRHIPNLGPRLTVMSKKGEVLARIGDIRAGREPGQFIAPHGIAVDSRGDVYVGEVSFTAWGQLFPGPAPSDLRCLQKLVKID